MTSLLKSCPFCGAPASMEEFGGHSNVKLGAVRFSVGCDSPDEVDCMGYQSLTTYPTRKDAAAAWNKRSNDG